MYQKQKTSLIVEWCHQKPAHGGRGLTINGVRINGFWVVKCNTVVSSLVEKWADLTTDRSLDGQPFTNWGVDMFDPFWSQELKR